MLGHDLTLYYFEACPYCQVVLNYIKNIDAIILKRDIRTEEGARDDLIAFGGKGQVPCLVIDGEALYESSEIIKWLEENI